MRGETHACHSALGGQRRPIRHPVERLAANGSCMGGKAAHRGQKGNSAAPPIIGCAMAPVGRRTQLVDTKAPPH